MELAPDDTAPRRSRQFLRRVLDSHVPSEVLDIALLLATELVTNAVLHGRSEIALEVESGDGQLRASVRDLNSRPPVLQDRDDDALDGRGLAIIDALASSWGVEPSESGKSVWFVLRTD